MRYLDTYKPIKVLMLCLIVALTSCEQNTNPANDTAIRLAPADGTEVKGQAATEDATVWAYKTVGETSSWLFNCDEDGRGATINTSANTIELDLKDGETAVPTEYWSNDKYTFFSLWPHVEGASVTVGDNLTFDFNALNQVDQLVSFNNYKFDGDATRTETVNFIYDHALAKIYIKLTKNSANNDDDVKLRKVTLKGFYASGTCTVSNKIEWSGTGDNKEETTVVLFEATEENALEIKHDEPYTVVGATTDTDGGYLVIPQTVDGTIQLIVEYDFYRKSTAEEGVTPEREPKTISTYIPSNTIKTWKPGLKHTYNCILKAESSKILFTTPDIKPWGRQQVGGTIIIQ